MAWRLLTNLRLRLRFRPEISYSWEISVELVITNKSQSLFWSINVSMKRYCCCAYYVTIFHSYVKGGNVLNNRNKYSKNYN